MADYKVELQEYIDKLDSQISGIDKILKMNTNGLLNIDVEEKLTKIKRNAKRLLKKLKNDEFEIAIVGLEKAGKSSFANALMGNNILPSKEARCTYTSTSIRYGDNTAKVEFFSHEEFAKEFQEKLKKLGIEHYETYTYEDLSLEVYQCMFEELKEEIKRYYVGNVNKDIEDVLIHKNNLSKYIGSTDMDFKGDELDSEIFKGFIQDPQCAIAVKEITLRSDKLVNMKNAIIYDVPGFDSPTQIHKAQTLSKMRTADAIILIASAYKPSFTGPIVEIFRNESDEDGIRFGDKMFVFVNMADRAEDLQGNMKKIEEELERHSIMSPDYFSSRIVPGSARAKLEIAGKIEGDMASSALEKMGIDDGIDLIKERLEEYNKSARFEILKQKVNRIQSDIREVFGNQFEKQRFMDSDLQRRSTELSLERYEKTVKEIKKNLETYATDLKERFLKNRPLTEKMRSDVISRINVEAYKVTDEEYNEAANHCLTVNKNPIPIEIEIDIRKDKHRKIYDNFSEGIVKVACREHEECDGKVLDIFMKALEIDTENPYYEELSQAIMEFIEYQKSYKESSGYYKSLVERFSTDLFEILLRYSFGDINRWGRFEDDRTNFYSLATYSAEYDLSVTPDKQSSHYLILFHSKRQSEFLQTVKKLSNSIESVAKIVVDPKIISLIRTIVNVEQEKAGDIVNAILSRVKGNKDADDVANMIITNLEDKIECYQEKNIDFSEVPLNRETYEKHFLGKQDKDKETIMEDVNEDISILQSILDDAVIQAICIEKPFLAYQIQTINNIIEALQNGNYRKFLVNNMHMICCSEFSQMQAEEQRKMAYLRMMEEIKQILDGMKSNSAINTREREYV